MKKGKEDAARNEPVTTLMKQREDYSRTLQSRCRNLVFEQLIRDDQVLHLGNPGNDSRTPRCAARRATIVLRKLDAAGRPLRQIELCDRHAETVIARERERGMEIFDGRDWR
jgi:hypothetical protein